MSIESVAIHSPQLHVTFDSVAPQQEAEYTLRTTYTHQLGLLHVYGKEHTDVLAPFVCFESYVGKQKAMSMHKIQSTSSFVVHSDCL